MGPSGVGKTTLLNMIIPGLQNRIAPVSNKIKRGKNTTRNVELFSLSNKSYIVDTPGFNMQTLKIDIFELSNLNKNFERYVFYKEMIESSKSHYSPFQED